MLNTQNMEVFKAEKGLILASPTSFQNERMRGRYRFLKGRESGTGKESKMAGKPSCLIVCSSASQGKNRVSDNLLSKIEIE